MEKLSALVSDFDDTLFFNKSALISAAKDLYETLLKGKEEDYKTFKDLEITIGEGRVPKGFNKKWKSELYTLAYVKYKSKLSPNLPFINYLKESVKQGNDLVILSARGEEFREQTEEILNKYGLNYSKIILPANHELTDEDWKMLEVKKLSEIYNHIVLFEDKEENIRHIIHNLKPGNVEFYLVDHSILTYITH
ncbi:MAG: hypothetical protein M1322_02520 [Candidatus Parvarchaeota archaeon]|jgi:hypothetical protein|nr:hypothetical protein [Candidatus Parvarchaeota archaeon]MCL5106964.1 hypothetical protein [Candidatus Parvarchaeota archaeon]